MGLNKDCQYSKLNILVIEDDEASCLLIKEILKPYWINLHFERNGIDGLKIINSSTKFDLLICDIRLPVISGYELAKAFKEMNPSKPVLIYTAILPQFLESSAYAYEGIINKPLLINQFADLVFKILHQEKEHFTRTNFCELQTIE